MNAKKATRRIKSKYISPRRKLRCNESKAKHEMKNIVAIINFEYPLKAMKFKLQLTYYRILHNDNNSIC